MIKKLKDYRLKDYELRISKFPPFQRHSLEKGNPPCYTANWIPNQVGNDVKE